MYPSEDQTWQLHLVPSFQIGGGEALEIPAKKKGHCHTRKIKRPQEQHEDMRVFNVYVHMHTHTEMCILCQLQKIANFAVLSW